ncbi:MAG: glycoside hydrolase family 127 protein, partial [Chitinophagaceae bacterium]
QRGPLMYCVEGADNDGDVWNLVSPAQTIWQEEGYKVMDENIVSLVANLPVVKIDASANKVNTTQKLIRAIPYYTWCNRGSNAMQMWLPSSIEDVKINYR